jgi:hypothetical protein
MVRLNSAEEPLRFVPSSQSLLAVSWPEFQETYQCKKCLILLARPKRFELLTPRFVVCMVT